MKVPIILEDEEFNAAVTIQKSNPRNAEKATSVGDQWDLFDLREEGIQIFPLAAFLLSESGLHQTPQTKSVMHAHYAATVRAFVVIVRGSRHRVSKAC